jgi:hypothetical protein
MNPPPNTVSPRVLLSRTLNLERPVLLIIWNGEVEGFKSVLDPVPI